MITINDLLEMKVMKDANLVAGEQGRGRIITWSHVIDHHDTGHFLEGGELLLTCGQIWPITKHERTKILESFLHHRISGIIFAVGRYLEACPEEVVNFGNQYSIPIIQVPFHVKFIQLTKEVQKSILHGHFEKLQQIKQLKPLNPKLLESFQKVTSIQNIIDIAAQYVRCPIFITDHTNKLVFEALPSDEWSYNLSQMRSLLLGKLGPDTDPYLQYGKNTFNFDESYFSIQLGSLPTVYGFSIRNGDDFLGTLWVYNLEYKDLHSTVPLINYTNTLLIDHIIHEQEISIIEQQERQYLLKMLIENHPLLQVIILDKLANLAIHPQEEWTLLYIPANSYKNHLESNDLKNRCHQWVQQTEEISGFAELYNEDLFLIITNSKLQDLPSLVKILKNDVIKRNQIPLFISKQYENYEDLHLGFQEVRLLSTFIPLDHQIYNLYFAKNYQKEILLYGAFDHSKALELSQNILPEKLVTSSEGVLLETLKVLMKNQYNREVTARILHIHRNTLRYRIAKIEKILGESLSSLLCQFWIKVAFDIEQVAYADIVHEVQNTSSL